MDSISGIDSSLAGAIGNAGKNSLKADDFIKLLLEQLSNQDPTKPLDNAEMMGQLTQIQTLQSQKELQGVLTSFAEGSNLAAASSMIGKNIRGTDDGGNIVTGTVGRLFVEEGKIVLQVGASRISFDKVTEVSQAPETVTV